MTPERALQDVDGVELADSWWDWINWRDIGYQGAGARPARGTSFVPDRNAGIWKPVYLETVRRRVPGTGHGQHRTALAQNGFRAADDLCRRCATTRARPVRGVLRATITRAGKPDVRSRATRDTATRRGTRESGSPPKRSEH